MPKSTFGISLRATGETSEVTIDVYEWNTDYNMTLAGTPAAKAIKAAIANHYIDAVIAALYQAGYR